MKNASHSEAQANNSTPILSAIVGSSWDACDENSLAVDGLDAIPYETLEASGIPRDVADQLNYRNLTPADVEDALGYSISDCWGVKYTNPDGSDVLVDGKPFIRVRLPDGVKGKYRTRTGAGNRIYFSPLLEPEVLNSGKPQLITEGEKGTDSANHHGFPCIGLAGVHNWKDKTGVVPELKEINFKHRDVLIVFDSDIHTNSHVQEAMFQLAELVCRRGATPKVVALPCELDGRKNGVDDFLALHGADALQRLIDIAQPSGHLKESKNPDSEPDFVRAWEPEPKNPHYIAVPLSTVMKESYADNPEVGIYKWRDSHWSRQTGKRPLHPPIHHWMDRQRFHVRGDGRVNTIVNEAKDYLEVRDWDSSNLTAFTNGTYDADTGVLHPGHNQEDRLTHCFPFAFDRAAKCPRWLLFLEETLKREDGTSDHQAINLMRAAIRWSICPKDKTKAFPYERGFDVQGPRGCGKGTLGEVLQALVGNGHGVVPLRSEDYANPNALADALGKKIAIAMDDTGHLSDVGAYNSVCSNELMKIKLMYKDIFAARLGIVPWRLYNDKPSNSQDGDEGMTRRLITFRIAKSVSAKRKDVKLKATLIAEIAGIYQWAMSMSEAEMADAFDNSGQIESIRKASLDSRLDANPWLLFLMEVCPDGLAETQASTLYGMYKRWATEDQGLRSPMKLKSFCSRLKKLIPYQMVYQRELNGLSHYKINPITVEKVAEYFGLDSVGSGSHPLPVVDQQTNPLPPKPLSSNGFAYLVEDRGDQTLLSAKDQKSKKNGLNGHVLKGSGKNPLDPLPGGLLTNQKLVQLALDAGCTDANEVIDWVPKNHQTKVGRKDVERCLKRLKQTNSSKA